MQEIDFLPAEFKRKRTNRHGRSWRLIAGAAVVGLLVIAMLEIRKVRGSILIGIVATTVLGMVFGEVGLPERVVGAPPSLAPIFLQMDVMSALKLGMWGAVFSFMFVDLFDSVGTIVACSYEAGLVKEDGSIERIDRVLEADAASRKPAEYHSRIRSELMRAQEAYMQLLLDE